MSITELMKSRRSVLKSLFAVVASAGAGLFGVSHFSARDSRAQAVPGGGQPSGNVPLFSGARTHGGLVYVAGKGEHTPGDIAAHTDAVLRKIEEELVRAGSSMEKVLKVNVYLADLADYDGMNAVFRGRFGDTPPVRTTVACYGGIPGDSLVEMDAIAYI